MNGSGHLYLSFHPGDAQFALRLAADLKNEGLSLWTAPIDVAPDAAQRALRDSKAVLSIVSPQYLRDCQLELSYVAEFAKPVVPVLLRPLPDWPLLLRKNEAFDFSRWPDEAWYVHQVQQFLSRMRWQFADQFGPIPGADVQAIYMLIARTGGYRGVLQYVDLVASTENTDETDPDSQPLRFTSIRRATARYRRFVLLGEPGAGKTTSLYRLAYEAAYRWLDAPKEAPFPLLLTLPGWERGVSPADLIRQSWPLANDPLPLLAEGKILLYLDGLNEMGVDGPYQAGRLRQWLHSTGGPADVIVTCRASDYGHGLELDLPTVQVESLDESHIHDFARQYLQDLAQDFLRRILPGDAEKRHRIRHLYHLAQNPYLLGSLIPIYESTPTSDLPSNTGRLFRALVQTLWERERQRQTLGWVPYDKMEATFGQLAYTLIDEYRPTHVSLRWVLRLRTGKRWYEAEEGSEAMPLLHAALSANLIAMQGQDVRFYHQLMLEFFAATHLKQIGVQQVLDKPRVMDLDYLHPKMAFLPTEFSVTSVMRMPTKWDQVIIALAGLEDDSDPIMQEIMAVDPYLAAECIENGVVVSPAILQTLKQILLEALEVPQTEPLAVNALVMLGNSAVPDLLDALEDPDNPMRWRIIDLLGQLGDPGAIPVLMATLDDPDSTLRYSAVVALGEIADPGTAGVIRDMLSDEDSDVRYGAATALVTLKDVDAIPDLLTALRDDDQGVRGSASTALGAIGSAAVPGLLEALKDSNPWTRALAARALGQIGDRQAITPLLDCLRDDESLGTTGQRVADYAHRALDLIDPRSRQS